MEPVGPAQHANPGNVTTRSGPLTRSLVLFASEGITPGVPYTAHFLSVDDGKRHVAGRRRLRRDPSRRPPSRLVSQLGPASHPLLAAWRCSAPGHDVCGSSRICLPIRAVKTLIRTGSSLGEQVTPSRPTEDPEGPKLQAPIDCHLRANVSGRRDAMSWGLANSR